MDIIEKCAPSALRHQTGSSIGGSIDRTVNKEARVTSMFGNTDRVYAGQIADALAHLEKLVVDGLRHGFFDYSVVCEIGPGGKRELVIRAGMSHKFTIPKMELQR
jgi:hypothetical protein